MSRATSSAPVSAPLLPTPEWTLLSFLDVAGWLALCGALLYAAGWAFAYHYFTFFHVGLLALEIPLQYYFIYSFWVIQHTWPWLVGVGAPLWVLLIGIRQLTVGARRWRIFHFLVVLLGPGILLGLFWGSYQAGKITAMAEYQVQMNQDYPDYPRVRVELKGMAPSGTSVSPQPLGLAEGCYRLLLQNRDRIFLFYSFSSDIPPAYAITGGVYSVPSQVTLDF